MSSTEGEQAVKNLTDKTSIDRLQKDLNAVRNDVSALAEQITETLAAFTGDARKQARRGYKQARSNVEGMVDDAREQGNAAYEMAQDYANSLEESLEEAITDRPLAAMGIAVGLGFLIGVTWRR